MKSFIHSVRSGVKDVKIICVTKAKDNDSAIVLIAKAFDKPVKKIKCTKLLETTLS